MSDQPTETEWEYACRAGTSTVYSFGDSATQRNANYSDGVAGCIKAVESYKPNTFSLYDMHGNVSEWCEDWHGEYPFAVTYPKGPAKGEYRVLRGGTLVSDVSTARSSNRGSVKLTCRAFFGGFRLARTQ